MKKLNNEIKDLQNKLNSNLKENELYDENVMELSNKIDELMNSYYLLLMSTRKFPSNSKMKSYYDKSYEELKRLTMQNNKFPELEEWNKYAKENKLLSSESMKYISMIEWKYLRLKVNREINKK